MKTETGDPGFAMRSGEGSDCARRRRHVVKLPRVEKADPGPEQLRRRAGQQRNIEAIERAMKAHSFGLEDRFLARPATVEAAEPGIPAIHSGQKARWRRNG